MTYKVADNKERFGEYRFVSGQESIQVRIPDATLVQLVSGEILKHMSPLAVQTLADEMTHRLAKDEELVYEFVKRLAETMEWDDLSKDFNDTMTDRLKGLLLSEPSVSEMRKMLEKRMSNGVIQQIEKYVQAQLRLEASELRRMIAARVSEETEKHIAQVDKSVPESSERMVERFGRVIEEEVRNEARGRIKSLLPKISTSSITSALLESASLMLSSAGMGEPLVERLEAYAQKLLNEMVESMKKDECPSPERVEVAQ